MPPCLQQEAPSLPATPLPPRAPKQVVSLHCNLDDNTRHLINAQRLALMKPDAVLVNAARGPCIDEAALVAHLKANPSFRAGEPAAAVRRCVCGGHVWQRAAGAARRSARWPPAWQPLLPRVPLPGTSVWAVWRRACLCFQAIASSLSQAWTCLRTNPP